MVLGKLVIKCGFFFNVISKVIKVAELVFYSFKVYLCLDLVILVLGKYNF